MTRDFIVTSKSGAKLEITTQIEVREGIMNEYTKELKVIYAKVNGEEIPGHGDSKKPFLMKITEMYQKREKYIVLKLEYDAWKFVKKLLGIKSRQDSGAVVVGKDLEEYYKNDFQVQAEEIINNMKTEKAEKIENAFNSIEDDDIIKFSKHTSYGIVIFHEAKEHEFFRSAKEKIEKSKIEIDNKFQTSVDWGDYSITSYYEMTLAEFKNLAREAEKRLKEIAAEKSEKATQKQLKEQKIFEKAKETGEMQVLRMWSEPCNDPNEECNLDNIIVYAMPDGDTKTVRSHTW